RRRRPVSSCPSRAAVRGRRSRGVGEMAPERQALAEGRLGPRVNAQAEGRTPPTHPERLPWPCEPPRERWRLWPTTRGGLTVPWMASGASTRSTARPDFPSGGRQPNALVSPRLPPGPERGRRLAADRPAI